jgi:hypothetical protein
MNTERTLMTTLKLAVRLGLLIAVAPPRPVRLPSHPQNGELDGWRDRAAPLAALLLCPGHSLSSPGWPLHYAGPVGVRIRKFSKKDF